MKESIPENNTPMNKLALKLLGQESYPGWVPVLLLIHETIARQQIAAEKMPPEGAKREIQRLVAAKGILMELIPDSLESVMESLFPMDKDGEGEEEYMASELEEASREEAGDMLLEQMLFNLD
ncbi:MAG: hypothetical protein ACR2PR_02525 [Pseudohongiellaceae bacterium]